MRSQIFRTLFPLFIIIMTILSACGGSPVSSDGTPTTRPVTPAQGLITWPFLQGNDQWAIVNAYRGNEDHAQGGSPNNYALFALDFARCLPNSVKRASGLCDITNGWDNTVGAKVYSPVSGTVAWPDENCHGFSLNIDGHPGFRIVLFHIDPLSGTSWTGLASNHTHLTQGDPIGTVSSGGCIGTGNHIHMALYSCTNCQSDPGLERVGHPFSDLWSISSCSFQDDQTTPNEYLGVLVPCNNATLHATTPTQRIVISQQTQSQTVNATGQTTIPGTQAKGTLSLRNPYHGSPRGVPVTYDAGTVFNDDTNRTPNVQMMIDATITVPGDGTSVTVPAHVVQIGTIGNIPIKGWTSYVNNLPTDIINITPFTGGTDPQSYTTVKQSDMDTATNSLKASTRQSVVADLNSQLRPNEHLVGDPQCTYNVISDRAAGDQSTTVTVTVKAMCTATAST